jgi:L-phenylalanine/L-methionine N-acetyltransferase
MDAGPPVPTIVVRRAGVADAAAFARIMGDPAVYPGLMQVPFTSAEVWQQRLTESTAPGKTDVVLAATIADEVVGTAGMHPVGPQLRRRHVMLIGISVDPAFQRRGVGAALMAAMCDYADRWAGVLRLELTVFADNLPAIALYRRFGFEVEGTHRAYALRDGVYVDVHAMARLHPRPPALPAR